MIDHHRARLLGMLDERPRQLREFSDGAEILQVSARHIANWLDSMVDEGLVLHTNSDEYRITEAGRAKLREKPPIAGPRDMPVDPNPWRPKPWVPARVGAEDHKRFKSLKWCGSSILTPEGP